SQKIIVIVGPTASGKSDLGIFLARKISAIGGPTSGWRGAEIISVDSRQVYRGMDIGTGKVKKNSIKYKVLSIKGRRKDSEYYSDNIRHHLIDVVSPKKVFTVSDFKKLGQKAINDIQCRYKVPIIVGGTGFYIDALVYDLNFPQVPPNNLLRFNLNRITAEQLFNKLKKLDPQRAKTIDPHNKRRLIRALEIIDSIGKVPALNTKYEMLNTKYDVLWIGLKPKNLEKRIKLRLDKRLKQGMVREVKNLIISGVSRKRLYDFGLEYRQVSEYLASKKFKVKSEKNFKNSEYYKILLRDIVKYSKRQMTWFKRNKEIHWVKNGREAQKLTGDFVR
ncbi:MAG: tRNA (adenosine(37)-N6)-dimethylallyltransferase MiaA, partial [Patescibacteria group bacterium]